MPRLIKPRQLTKTAFAPFGDVIEIKDAESRIINEGHTTRFHDLADLNLTADGGKPSINIFRSKPIDPPLRLSLMERHPLSSQAFFPLSQARFLVVVAPPGDLVPEGIEAFLTKPGQGVNYHAGTWHHYCIALDRETDFLVVDRNASDENCDEIRLDDSNSIQIEMGE